MRGRVAGVSSVALMALTLTGCVDVGVTQQEVRHLVTDTQGNFTVVARDDASVQDMLGRASDALLVVADGKPWTAVNNNDLNEEIIEVTFVQQDRSPNRYGGGTEAASTLIKKNVALLAMSGDSGVCWGLRMDRTAEGATLTYTSIFSPECTANELQDAKIAWTSLWPSPAVPDADFVPPAPPDENLPGGLTPDDLAPQQDPAPTETNTPTQ